MSKKDRDPGKGTEGPQGVPIARSVVGPKGYGLILEGGGASRTSLRVGVVQPNGNKRQKTFVLSLQGIEKTLTNEHFTSHYAMPNGFKGIYTTNFDAVLEELLGNLPSRQADFAIRTVISPQKKTSEGLLIKSLAIPWRAIVEKLQRNWAEMLQIPPHFWEELIAGAYDRAGFDEVILTPRSGDHGRDIIAVRRGIGSIRILGAVKAYKPGHLVTKQEIHALMGVVSADPNASKGIFTTTSDFAPRLLWDPRVAAAVPHRIELMNGERLREWLKSLLQKK